MSRIKIILLLILLFPAVGMAAVDTHYVTQSGAGSGLGTSLLNAFSVASFNTAGNWDVDVADDDKIGPGDTVYFSGTITTPLYVQGSGNAIGGNIILDGYESGDCDFLLSESSCGVIVDTSWTMYEYGISLNAHAENPSYDYITVQDFQFETSYSAILLVEGCDNITIQRNFINDTSGNGITVGCWGSDACTTNYYVTIQENVIKNSAGEYDGSASIYMMHTEDFVIRSNHIYTTPDRNDGQVDDRGTDGIIPHNNVHRGLIEYNEIHGMLDSYSAPGNSDDLGEDGIDLKAEQYTTVSDVIIRYNNIYDNNQGGITVHGAGVDNTYIYGNKLKNNYWHHGLWIGRGAGNTFVWSNIINKNRNSGIAIYDTDPYTDGDPSNVNIWNNSIVDNGYGGSNDNAGIYPAGVDDNCLIKNNILFHNTERDNEQIYVVSTGVTDMDNNLYYFNSLNWPVVRWGASSYALAGDTSLLFGATGQEENGDVGDPHFINIDNEDYRLTNASVLVFDLGEVISTGVLTNWSPPTIQGIDYSEEVDPSIALHPNTDWTTTPPTVAVVDRDTYGWSRGAYAFPTSGIIPIVLRQFFLD